MRPIEKYHIKEVLGKQDILRGDFPLIGNLTFFDNDGSLHPAYIDYHEKGILIAILNGFSKKRYAILFSEFDFITIEPQQLITEKKNKSVIGRALLGGLILGPLGAIVGGMSGIGQKDVKMKTPENLLIIKLKESQPIFTFSVSNSNYKRIRDFFKKGMPDTYKEPDELDHVLHPKEELPKSPPLLNQFSIADEINKLKSLLDNGVLSQEEFQQFKQKLMSSQ